MTEEDLAEVVQRVDQAEGKGKIGTPDTQADVPTSIIPVGKDPQPGDIVQRCEMQTASICRANKVGKPHCNITLWVDH